jgi:hypothetical protein
MKRVFIFPILAVLLEDVLIVPARELRPTIRMQNRRACSLTLPHGHKHRPHDHLAFLLGINGPADDQIVEEVENDAEVEPVLVGSDVGDVRHPPRVRCCRSEVSLEVILDALGANARSLVTPGLSLRDPSKPLNPHQTCHAIHAAQIAFSTELRADARAALHLVAGVVKRLDPLAERCVLASSRPRLTASPREIGRR